ncbi:MAG: ATP-binding protein [Thermodesulfobacteriota bacterium]
MKIRSTFLLGLLMCGGLLGNYFTIPLFFGADFLFGSIAVLLVLYFYGLAWGMLAAVAAHSYTWFLWGHPFGFINFVSEALFVGIFLKRGRRNLLALDAVFWLLLGMPLAWLYHGVVMQMDATTATFIMLKQAINGVFSAMLISLAICLLPLGRLFQRSQSSTDISLQETLFDLLVMMVLLPTLFLTMLEARQAKESLEGEVIANLESTSANLRLHLHSWFQLHLHAVRELARSAGLTSMTPDAQLQRDTEILANAFPNFNSLHVENEEGCTIAFSPSVNEKGESTIGHDFSDRRWFQECKARQKPVVSEIFHGRIGVFAPITVIAAPIKKEDRWLGTATGSLDLGMVQEILKPYGLGKNLDITLTDSREQVIASTTPKRPPMQVWDRRYAGVFQPLGNQMYFWHPDDRRLPSMTRWKQSFYVQEITLGPELPWKLTMEASVAPLQNTLYTIYVKNLAMMALLAGLSLFFSLLLSRWLARPLARLAQVTADLPARLSENQKLDWPASSALEINSLIANAKSMARTLEQNVQELRRRSEELQESESKYRVLFEGSADGIFLMRNTFLDCNEQACKLWRCEREDILGHSPQEFSPPFQPDGRSSAEAAQRYIEAALTGEPQFFSWQHRRKDGALIFCEISLNAVMLGGEKIIQATLRDITGRKAAEEERAKLQAQLSQAQKMESVGRLAGGVAHDFNNMLGIIIGNAELGALEADPFDPAHKKFKEIIKAGNRSADLVRQLLAFARKQTISPKVLDLNDTVSGTLKMLRRLIGEDIELAWSPGHNVWPVKMDSSQLDQILANLAVNAKDAIAGVGKVTMETDNATLDEAYCANHEGFIPGQYARLAVSDTGTGMTQDVLKHLFEPFFSTKELGKGTGLGLATVYGIVKQNNGFINVYSEPGHGTTFKIYFPRFEGEAAPAPERADENRLPEGTETVLLAEDEGPLLGIARDILERLGYTVLSARTPTEALSLAQRHPGLIHLLLTDVVMPEMNGRALWERVQAEQPGIKCLFMSGYTANVVAHHGVLDEGVHFIEKPFSARALAEGVRKVLDKR